MVAARMDALPLLLAYSCDNRETSVEEETDQTSEGETNQAWVSGSSITAMLPLMMGEIA